MRLRDLRHDEQPEPDAAAVIGGLAVNAHGLSLLPQDDAAMRSVLNDDTSKPLLDSITKGIGQLSPEVPGYVGAAIQ